MKNKHPQADCETCVLLDQPYVPSSLPRGPLALVGEAPGDWEVAKQIPFVGMSGKLLRGVMSYLDYPMHKKKVGLINVACCQPVNNEFPDNDEHSPVACCKERFQQETRRYRVLVALGAKALYAIAGLRGIASWRGCVLGLNANDWVPWDTKTPFRQLVVIARHPAFVSRTPLAKRALIADLHKAVRLAKGEQLNWSERNFKLAHKNSVEYLDAMHDGKPVAIDIETNGEHYKSDSFRMTAVSFAHHTRTVGFLWPVVRGLSAAVRRLLMDTKVPKAFQGSQFDVNGLKAINLKTQGTILDTLLLHHSFAVGQPHNLEYLRTIFTDSPHRHHEYDIANREEFLRDNARHATVTLKILKPLQAMVNSDIYRQSMKLSKVCQRMTDRGIMVHKENRAKIIHNLKAESAKHFKRVRKVAPDLNPRSPMQVAELIYGELGLPIRLRTKTGEPSTSKDAISLILEHATRAQTKILKSIVDYRQTTSLLTGMEKLPILQDGAVHSRFNVHGAVTRRFSSSEPNMQNVRHDMRKAFVARPGFKFVGVDFKQLELRVMAYLAEDEPMMRAFREGKDIHFENCIALYGPKRKYTKDERTKGKNFVFGGNYGAGIEKRYAILRLDHPEISLSQVAEMAMNWDKAHPALVRWRMKQIRERKPMAQLSGYTLPYPSVTQCQNFPIQATATDIMHLWTLQVCKRSDLWPLLQIHDSIIFEARGRAKIKFEPFIVELNGRECEFPLDVKEGKTWDQV